MKSEIRALKYVYVIENVLCLHRNWTAYNKIPRMLLLLHMVIEITLIATTFYLLNVYRNNFFNKEILYFCSITTFSIVVIVIAGFKSESFKMLMNYLNANHAQCERDGEYCRKMERVKWVVICWAGSLTSMQVFVFAQIRFTHNMGPPEISFFVFNVLLLMCDFRYNFQFLVIYCHLKVMSEQICFITRSVDASTMVKDEVMTQKQRDVFDVWCELYTNVSESSKLFNDAFGSQMTMMLAIMTFYYIIFLYTLTSVGLAGNILLIGLILYTFATVILVIAVIVMSYTAQAAQNNADVLKRTLAKLVLQSLENEVYYKPAKDLQRLVSITPISIRAFGSIAVDMSLLPTLVVFFTSYTVIALQLNNIV